MSTVFTVILIGLSTKLTLRVMSVEGRIGTLSRLGDFIPGQFLSFVFPWMALSLLNSSGRTWFYLVLGLVLGAGTPLVYASPLAREYLAEIFKRHPQDIVIWAAIMTGFTTCLFGVALSAFSFWGWVPIDSGAHSMAATPIQADLYFLWQLANAIPVLELPAALHWTPTISHTGVAVGIMTVIFKLMVAIPTVAIVTHWWHRRRVEAVLREWNKTFHRIAPTKASNSERLVAQAGDDQSDLHSPSE